MVDWTKTRATVQPLITPKFAIFSCNSSLTCAYPTCEASKRSILYKRNGQSISTQSINQWSKFKITVDGESTAQTVDEHGQHESVQRVHPVDEGETDGHNPHGDGNDQLMFDRHQQIAGCRSWVSSGKVSFLFEEKIEATQQLPAIVPVT